MNLIKIILKKKHKTNEVDERQLMEFNNIISFCFRSMVVSIIIISVLYHESFEKYIEIEMLNLYVISLISFIGTILLCRKGILVLNKNFEILYPVFLFFPFFLLKITTIFLDLQFSIILSTPVRIILTFIYLILIYFFIQYLYIKGVNQIEIDND